MFNLEEIGKTLLTHGGKIVVAILIAVAGYILIRLIIRMMDKAIIKSKLDKTVHNFLISLSTVVLYIILIIIVLDKLGIPMGSMVAAVGAIGIAVGLAVQSTLANFAGGIMILFTKPFVAGDFIDVDGIQGTVSSVSIIQTKLNTIDNKAIYIPNGQVSAARITNFSAEKIRRLDINFSINYSTDLYAAQEIIKALIEDHPLALKDPAPIVRVCELGANAVILAVRVWVATENYWDLDYDLLEQVKTAFDQKGIDIPYNQMVVTVKK